MKLGIIHLSDCHMDDCDERFLARTGDIALTVRAIGKADAWIILFSGDLSQKGESCQIQRGAAFLAEVHASMAGITGMKPLL